MARDEVLSHKRSEWGRQGAAASFGPIEKKCLRCGRPLYARNRTDFCTSCQREFGLPTLRKRYAGELRTPPADGQDLERKLAIVRVAFESFPDPLKWTGCPPATYQAAAGEWWQKHGEDIQGALKDAR